MSKAGYVMNKSQLHIFKCEWVVDGRVCRHEFKYTGSAIDGLIACYKTVQWSGHPTFRVVELVSKTA